jgi:hypothetical protein
MAIIKSILSKKRNHFGDAISKKQEGLQLFECWPGRLAANLE